MNLLPGLCPRCSSLPAQVRGVDDARTQSSWSAPVGISLVGLRSSVSVLCDSSSTGALGEADPRDAGTEAKRPPSRSSEFEFGLAIDNAPGKFQMSVVVNVTPHLLLVNHSGLNIEYRQFQPDLVSYYPTPVFLLPPSGAPSSAPHGAGTPGAPIAPGLCEVPLCVSVCPAYVVRWWKCPCFLYAGRGRWQCAGPPLARP